MKIDDLPMSASFPNIGPIRLSPKKRSPLKRFWRFLTKAVRAGFGRKPGTLTEAITREIDRRKEDNVHAVD